MGERLIPSFMVNCGYEEVFFVVVKLSFARIEGVELMAENFCFATHSQDMLQVLQADFVFRRIALGIIGVVVRYNEIPRVYMTHQVGERRQCSTPAIVAHVFFARFQGSSVQGRAFPLDKILIDVIETTVLA